MNTPQADGTPDLKSWLEENYRHLLWVAFLITRDRQLAEDIAQDASLKIMRAWPNNWQRDMIITSRAYVFTIVLNAFRSHQKVPSRTKKFEVPLEPKHDVVFQDTDAELRELLVGLPDDERALLILRYYFGETIVEAGHKLGLSRDGAYRLNQKAFVSLRTLLKDQED